MPQRPRLLFATLPRRLLTLALILAGAQAVTAQPAPEQEAALGAAPGNPHASLATSGQIGGKFLQVPINTIVPGAVPVKPNIKVPALDDPAAAQRGMKDFNAFNCVGCHMGNGGGGMGPSLSDGNFKYGNDPANIYLTIVQGRPLGMPAWGSVLPDEIVWDLVAYVRSLAKGPTPEWGQTVSVGSPKIEQVPAERNQSPNPWQQTEPFTSGQKP